MSFSSVSFPQWVFEAPRPPDTPRVGLGCTCVEGVEPEFYVSAHRILPFRKGSTVPDLECRVARSRAKISEASGPRKTISWSIEYYYFLQIQDVSIEWVGPQASVVTAAATLRGVATVRPMIG